MQRSVSFLVAWLIAAAVATMVAWQGVGLVGEQVTSERPAPLDAREVQERLVDEAADADAPTTTTTESASGPTSTTVGQADPAPGPRPEPPADVPVSSGPTGQSPAPGSAAPTPQPTASPPTATSSTRTYNLVGGTASLRFTPSGVTVDYATPKAGFTVEIERENGNGVKVEFRSDDHRSRVDGWWDGGPRERIREEPG